MSSHGVSVILRSYNEGWALGDTLAALSRQTYRDYELIAFDSGSTDGSTELIACARPAHFIRLKTSEYNPSRVINQGMRLASSELCVFLNADATPRDENWLEPLVRGLTDPSVAAVFGRQIPRPDCQAVFACDYDRCFGANRESAKWDHFFSMVSSGLRKDIWSKRGFREDLQYAEDHEYSLWCRNQGYGIVYCPVSVVIHSHNYTPAQAYKRSFGDARASAAWSERGDVSFWKTVVLGSISDMMRDLAWCAKQRRLGEWFHAARIRLQQRRGKLRGFRQGWEEYRGE